MIFTWLKAAFGSPMNVFFLTLLINLPFILVSLALRLVSHLLTPPIAVLFWMLLAYAGVVATTQSIAYPGSTYEFSRTMEASFSRNAIHAELVQTLDVVERVLKTIGAQATSLEIFQARFRDASRRVDEKIRPLYSALLEMHEVHELTAHIEKFLKDFDALDTLVEDAASVESLVKAVGASALASVRDSMASASNRDELNVIDLVFHDVALVRASSTSLFAPSTDDDHDIFEKNADDVESGRDETSSDVDGDCSDDDEIDENTLRHNPVLLATKNVATSLSAQFKSYRSARRSFKGLASLEFMRSLLSHRLGGERELVQGSESPVWSVERWIGRCRRRPLIDTMFFPSLSDPSSTKCVVFAMPNGGMYEFLLYNRTWIDFYRSRGASVLAFNYRAYGASEGSPSPRDACRDAGRIFESLRVSRGITRVAVHGESIGGIVAAYAASKASDFGVEVVVADRAFSSFPDIVGALVLPKLASVVAKMPGWGVSVADMLVDDGANVAKVLTCDPDDTIIKHRASLKYGVVRSCVASNIQELGDLAIRANLASREFSAATNDLLTHFSSTSYPVREFISGVLAFVSCGESFRHHLAVAGLADMDDFFLASVVYRDFALIENGRVDDLGRLRAAGDRATLPAGTPHALEVAVLRDALAALDDYRPCDAASLRTRVGDLVPLTCGHNADPSPEEFAKIASLVEKSGFLS